MHCPKCGSEMDQQRAEPDCGITACSVCTNDDCGYVCEPEEPDDYPEPVWREDEA